MGGLQEKVIGRNKGVEGSFLLLRPLIDRYPDKDLISTIKSFPHPAYPEYQIEVLLKDEGRLAPLILRGVDVDNFGFPGRLNHLKGSDLILSHDFRYRYHLRRGDEVRIISPAHADTVFGDLPRAVTARLESFVSTDVPELDQVLGHTRLGFVQNFIREASLSGIRFFGNPSESEIRKHFNRYLGEKSRLLTWEEEHKTLVYALSLENTVMIFLFIGMTVLVGLCIVSGLLLFLDKIRLDLASFWILGLSTAKIDRLSQLFIILLSVLSSLSGIIVASIGLIILEKFGGNIMPEGFVDRKIPVQWELSKFWISFIVPCSVSLLVSLLALKLYRRDERNLDLLRTI